MFAHYVQVEQVWTCREGGLYGKVQYIKRNSHMGSPMDRRQNDTTKNLTFVTLLPGFNKTFFFYYRPQRNCWKVMFLHLSVSHSVHGGCISACIGADTPPSWQTPSPRRPLQRTVRILLECIFICSRNWTTYFLSVWKFGSTKKRDKPILTKDKSKAKLRVSLPSQRNY